jgi:hypothetical protein
MEETTELKRYVIKAFDNNQDAEDFINENALGYRPINITDTPQYVTVLLERRDL